MGNDLSKNTKFTVLSDKELEILNPYEKLTKDSYSIKMHKIPGSNIEVLQTEVTNYLWTSIYNQKIGNMGPVFFDIENKNNAYEWITSFCNELSILCGYEPCYDGSLCNKNANGFRLPDSSDYSLYDLANKNYYKMVSESFDKNDVWTCSIANLFHFRYQLSDEEFLEHLKEHGTYYVCCFDSDKNGLFDVIGNIQEISEDKSFNGGGYRSYIRNCDSYVDYSCKYYDYYYGEAFYYTLDAQFEKYFGFRLVRTISE